MVINPAAQFVNTQETVVAHRNLSASMFIGVSDLR